MLSLRPLSALCILSLCLSASVSTAAAQSADSAIGLSLEPHCASEDRTQCPVYTVSDASHLTTGTVNVDDIVDVDVVLLNAASTHIETIRSWLRYDPAVLEARSVTLTPVIAKPIPGEQSVSSTLQLVKIGGGAGEIKNNRTAIARVTFRVKSGGNPTDISFENYREDGLGQTAVNGTPTTTASDKGLPEPPCIVGILCPKKMTPLLGVQPSALTVLLVPVHSAAPEPAAAPTPDPSMQQIIPILGAGNANANLPDIPQNTESAFSLLQVQMLKITSRDNSIFLGWQPLRSSELAGYNVYFSAVSGKYIQRKSIASTASSLVLRDLEPGTTYYVAIRAFNRQNVETVFSQEVSVTVGKPETASAPLTGKLVETQPVQGNPVETRGGTQVSGETGMSDTLVLFMIISAVIGTAFAAHRQFAFAHLSSHGR